MLIAMAILSLGLLAAASMQYGSMRNNSKGGVAEVLNENIEQGNTRYIYTYTGTSASLMKKP